MNKDKGRRTKDEGRRTKDEGQRTKDKVQGALVLGFVCTLYFVLGTSARAADVQEFVFLGEARPVLVRMHVRVDGKPLQASWDDLVKYLFNCLDVNGDGTLSKEEAGRAPSSSQIINGGVGGGGFGGFGGRGRTPAGPSFEALDVDKDGKATLVELAAWYRKNGLAPFQFQLGGQQANPFGGAAALFGGGRAEPSVSAVSEAAFTLLDTDKDGKLSKDELAAAPAALLRLDEDEDEIVTGMELVPNAAGDNPLAGLMAMGMQGQPSNASNRNLVPIATPGEAPADLVRFMMERYGPKTDDEKKLGRKDLGLDEATFKQLDANGDGKLDAQELAGFVKRAPDLELVLRLGTKEAKEARLELVNTPDRPSPLAGKVRIKDGLALLDLGVTRVDLRGGEEDPADRFGEYVQQQVLGQLKQADTDGNGVIDEAEAKNNQQFRGIFKMVDRDGDGKVTEKELTTYLDQARELQARARAGCVSLALTDQSRGLFDLLDTNRDGRLGVREMRQAPKLMEQFDPSGKGSLTKADIPRSYRLALRRGPADPGALGGAAVFVALYGGNNRNEPEQQLTAGPVWLRRMDRNRDGDVSRKEFLFSEEEFRRIDTDGDGLISVEEAEKADAQSRKEK